MENAAKALMMAGGVLIGLLLVSLAVFLFSDFGSTAAEINARRTQTQIAEFNARFTAFEGNDDLNGGRKKWTIYDVITVAGYARENNQYYIDNFREYGVTVTLTNHGTIEGETQNIDSQQLLQEVMQGQGIEANTRVYICNVRKDNPNGRVSRVEFILQP